MPELHTKRLKSLFYRCQHRGSKELDLLLGGFARKYLGDLTPQQLDDFEQLLECPENDVLSWVTQISPIPPLYQTDVMKMLFEYASSTR